jgi:alpha-tubulin suppressor-like RCC1 family protein
MDTFENIDVKFISASKHRFCGAVDANGHLYAWGQDDALQLGLGGEALFLDVHRVENVPRLVEYFYDQDVKVVDISLGQKGMLVCTEDGRVYETGDHKWALPNLVKGDNGNFLKHKIVGVARGNKFGAAVDEHGRLFSWGVNSSGGLGVGMAKTNVVSPVPVPALSDGKVGNRVVSITAGMRNMAAFVN